MNTNILPIQTPPPISQHAEPPTRRTPHWKVIGFSLGSFLFFVMNVFLALLNTALRQQHMMLIAFIGYVVGNIVLPAGVIIGVASCWKANRRPYNLLRWLFWILVGMTAIKLLLLLQLFVEGGLQHRPTN